MFKCLNQLFYKAKSLKYAYISLNIKKNTIIPKNNGEYLSNGGIGGI